MPGFGGSPSGSKMQTRPGGGFRQSFGNFSDEHEEANAMSSAAAQKQTAQQSSVLGQQGLAKQQAAASGSGQTPLANPESSKQQQAPPRGISNLGEELITRPAKDILNTFKSFFDLNALLGINPGDTPEKKAKKQKIASNWQKLTQEEQAFVQQEFQRTEQKKQQELKEEQAKKEEEERQAQEQSITPPSSPRRGANAPAGNKKQQTSQLMQNKRTQMSQSDG